MPASVSALYHTLGTWDQAEAYMANIAQSIIMTEATHYTAEDDQAAIKLLEAARAALRKYYKKHKFEMAQFRAV